jgi:hypothetical protein
MEVSLFDLSEEDHWALAVLSRHNCLIEAKTTIENHFDSSVSIRMRHGME